VAKKRSPTVPVTHARGRVIAAFRNGVYLIDTGKVSRNPIAPADTAAALGLKLVQALNKPGVSREAVFGTEQTGRTVYAYSVHPDDPTMLLRETADGKCAIGRMVNGRFRAIRKARRT
jgi:hypothetical protein